MLPDTPKVTVLMPVWNGAAYLAPAVDSMCAQTFRDFELLVIDDGSGDGTPEILARYERQDRRVRVVRHAHRGLVAALNLGLSMAGGEYVARMDADDVSLPDRLAKQVAFMAAQPQVGLCGGWVELLDVPARAVWRLPTHDADLRGNLLFGCSFYHPTVMLRRAAFSNLRYDATYPHAEDYELWARCTREQSFRLANVPRVLLRLRQHPGRVSERFAGVQRAAAARVRAAQLRWSGVEASSTQLRVHETICELQPPIRRKERVPVGAGFVNAADAWLQTLYQANDRTRRYDGAAFARLIVNRWGRVCAACAPAGGALWTGYWSSPIARLARPSLRMTATLALASLPRRRGPR